jgi:uncharacterized SAM-binding protein YcdF (DUF218 family)
MLGKLLFAVLIAVIIVVVTPIAIAVYLSPQDELEKTGAIVVISGGDTDARIQEAVELYMQKWAPLMITSGAAATGNVSNALAMKRIAISKGVPASTVLIEEESKTTAENAKFVKAMLREKEIESIILVTSPYHQRRANNEFKKQMGKEYKIINHSAKDMTWRKKNWWESANARFLTIGEILKNFYGLTQN